MIGVLTVSIAAAVLIVHVPKAAYDKRILTEQQSIAAYENVLHSFSTPGSDVRYPDHYAGAYIDTSGKLVILIAPSGYSGFGEASSAFREFAGAENTKVVLFREVLHSYSVLLALMEQFNDAFLSNLSNPDSIWSHVTGFALHEDLNCISVEILDIDDSKIERFKAEASASAAVEFKNSRRSSVAESLHPGMMANTGSIGFRARMGEFYGFVTAGHNTSTDSSVYRRERIGTCVTAIVDSTLDGAFVRTDEWIGEIENTTHMGRLLSGINTNPIQGATVFKEGRATGLTIGNIISTNATHQYRLYNGAVTITRTNILVADYRSAANDSGGVVYDANNLVLGIHLAGPPRGLPGERLVEKVCTLQNVLGVTFY